MDGDCRGAKRAYAGSPGVTAPAGPGRPVSRWPSPVTSVLPGPAVPGTRLTPSSAAANGVSGCLRTWAVGASCTTRPQLSPLPGRRSGRRPAARASPGWWSDRPAPGAGARAALPPRPVHRRQRLVQEQQAGLGGQSASQCHPLRLAAGELVRAPLGQLRGADAGQPLVRRCCGGSAAAPAQRGPNATFPATDRWGRGGHPGRAARCRGGVAAARPRCCRPAGRASDPRPPPVRGPDAPALRTDPGPWTYQRRWAR